MNPGFTVCRQGRRAKEFRQFAGRPAPHQVHLEETLLCVCIAERPRDVMTVPARELSRFPQIIALDGDWSSEAGRLQRAIIPGQAPMQCQPDSACRKRDEHKKHKRQRKQQPIYRAKSNHIVRAGRWKVEFEFEGGIRIKG